MFWLVIFFVFSSPDQNKSSLQDSYGGGGQDKSSLWNPCSLRQGEQALFHIPYGAKTTGISGGFAVPLKWCEVFCFVRSPTEGEIEGALWKPLLEAPAPAQEMTSLQELCGYCKGICFAFLFLSSLRHPPGPNQLSLLGSALRAGSSHSTFSSLIWNFSSAKTKF